MSNEWVTDEVRKNMSNARKKAIAEGRRKFMGCPR